MKVGAIIEDLNLNIPILNAKSNYCCCNISTLDKWLPFLVRHSLIILKKTIFISNYVHDRREHNMKLTSQKKKINFQCSLIRLVLRVWLKFHKFYTEINKGWAQGRVRVLDIQRFQKSRTIQMSGQGMVENPDYLRTSFNECPNEFYSERFWS